jgi:hypothetical protein
MKLKAILGSTMLVATVILGVFAVAPSASAHFCTYEKGAPENCGISCKNDAFHYHFEGPDGKATFPDKAVQAPAGVGSNC